MGSSFDLKLEPHFDRDTIVKVLKGEPVVYPAPKAEEMMFGKVSMNS